MNNKLIVLIVLIVVILIIQSCELILPCRDTDFSFLMEENNTNKLKLNGYYYSKILHNDTLVDIYLLNQNGVFSIPHCSSNFLTNVETGNITIDIPELAYKYKSHWGIYKITDDSIEIQKWMPENNGCVYVEAFKGIILNDSTFAITKWYAFDRGGIYGTIDTIYSIWKFHKYSPKPDSVVSFIP